MMGMIKTMNIIGRCWFSYSADEYHFVLTTMLLYAYDSDR